MEVTQPPKFNWPIGLGLLIIHIGALGVFFSYFFSWSAVAVAIFLVFLSALGLNIGFHRLLTHHSFKTSKFFEYFLATLGSLTLQSGPIKWVTAHRLHHAFADTPNDPHNSRRGFFWAHMGWLFLPNPASVKTSQQPQYAPELWKDRYYRFLNYTYINLLLQIILGFILFYLGGWPWVIWGIFARLVFFYHTTWFVNSACHFFGYRTYDTNDRSTNCWWVALCAAGEGWHNNHHKFANSAKHGLRWYEFDISWLMIHALAGLGLIWDIHIAKPEGESTL